MTAPDPNSRTRMTNDPTNPAPDRVRLEVETHASPFAEPPRAVEAAVAADTRQLVPPTNRDGKGRFLRGHALPGPGRPRGFDVRASFVQTNGEESAEEAILGVMAAMIARAKAGDPQCARIVLDRLAGPIVQAVDATVSGDSLSDAERATRVAALLALASVRLRDNPSTGDA